MADRRPDLMRGTTVPPGTPTPGGDLPMHRLEVPLPATLPFAVGTFDTIGPLSRASRLAAGPEPRPGTVAEEFTRLTARPGAEWSVRAYAERIGVTPGHLTEAVKAATGRPASALVREARVREAKRLLTGTTLTVRQVAARVGFGDPAYFCRFFRRETGLTPGRFRENHHERRD